MFSIFRLSPCRLRARLCKTPSALSSAQRQPRGIPGSPQQEERQAGPGSSHLWIIREFERDQVAGRRKRQRKAVCCSEHRSRQPISVLCDKPSTPTGPARVTCHRGQTRCSGTAAVTVIPETGCRGCHQAQACGTAPCALLAFQAAAD